MLERPDIISQIDLFFEVMPICGILGPRQVGKTTLAELYSKKFTNCHRFDLEDPYDLALLRNPKASLADLKGLIIIDEIQRLPELFPYLRVFVDRNPDIKILILGSSAPSLLRQSSETLAGRIGYIELTPFDLLTGGDQPRLFTRGGFPKSYLANTWDASSRWRKSYINTFLEQDLAALGFDITTQNMRNLWTMIAHYHGNIMNYSEFSRSLSMSEGTIRKYLHILENSFMVRVLRPWFANIKKRQIKSPKVYIRDSGLLHSLLRIEEEDIKMHPKVGAAFEGFALEEVIKSQKLDASDCYFWHTQNGAELDLFVAHHPQKIGFEFKYTDAPKITKSMRIAKEDLGLDKLYLVTPHSKDADLGEGFELISLKTLATKAVIK